MIVRGGNLEHIRELTETSDNCQSGTNMHACTKVCGVLFVKHLTHSSSEFLDVLKFQYQISALNIFVQLWLLLPKIHTHTYLNSLKISQFLMGKQLIIYWIPETSWPFLYCQPMDQGTVKILRWNNLIVQDSTWCNATRYQKRSYPTYTIPVRKYYICFFLENPLKIHIFKRC